RTPLTRNTSKRGSVIFFCISLLLCGDVQVNPGPVAPLKHQVSLYNLHHLIPFHQEYKVTLRQFGQITNKFILPAICHRSTDYRDSKTKRDKIISNGKSPRFSCGILIPNQRGSLEDT
ncbi:hypothetical protein GOODEAATRI_034589, partial [Goodea atripinnis]